MECTVCGKECQGKCCSGACRAKLSRQAHGEAHALSAHGQAHGADLTPAHVKSQLDAWRGGSGTTYQQQLSTLAHQYSIMHA